MAMLQPERDSTANYDDYLLAQALQVDSRDEVAEVIQDQEQADRSHGQDYFPDPQHEELHDSQRVAPEDEVDDPDRRRFLGTGLTIAAGGAALVTAERLSRVEQAAQRLGQLRQRGRRLDAASNTQPVNKLSAPASPVAHTTAPSISSLPEDSNLLTAGEFAPEDVVGDTDEVLCQEERGTGF
jgi:hypothetical protein